MATVNEKAYRGFYDSFKRKYLEQIEGEIRKPSDFRIKIIVQELVSTFYQTLEGFTSKREEANTSSVLKDYYNEKLIQDFKERGYTYREDTVKGFFKHSFERLKAEYKKKTIKIHGLYDKNEIETLEFLGEYFALDTLYKALSQVNNSSDVPREYLKELYAKIKEIEYNISVEHKTVDVITFQQVLMMHYIFEELKVNGRRLKNAKARFIKALTNKSEDKILEVLGNPGTFKKSLSKRMNDYQAVISYFKDIELDKIVKKISDEAETIEKTEKSR